MRTRRADERRYEFDARMPRTRDACAAREAECVYAPLRTSDESERRTLCATADISILMLSPRFVDNDYRRRRIRYAAVLSPR